MTISPARTAAFDILSRIEKERAFSSVLLPEYEQRLSPKDRALCHQLTLGVLRRQIYLDKMSDFFASGKRLDLSVRISLRIGLYQLLFLDKIPAHSAVNESVNLVQRAKKSSARGFVNAILRRTQRESFTPTYADEVERISIETSHPRWLIEKWAARWGLDEAARLAESNNTLPAIAFRLTARSAKEPAFPNTRPSDTVPGCFLADALTPEIRAAAETGQIYFQDEGSQLVGRSVVVPADGRFLDVCAAPGSKATQIAARDKTLRVVAGDIHSHRTRFLLENIRSQGVPNASVVEYDAEKELPFEDGSFDSVLVDAPCTGTGTIRHNPELRYFLRPKDFLELSAKQRRILAGASKLVRKGGSLVYSTCSLESEENEAVADDFLTRHPDFEKSEPHVPDRYIGDDGYARTRPDIDKMDGFFIASFRRRDT